MKDLSFLSVHEKQFGTRRRNTDSVADKDFNLVQPLIMGMTSLKLLAPL